MSFFFLDKISKYLLPFRDHFNIFYKHHSSNFLYASYKCFLKKYSCRKVVQSGTKKAKKRVTKCLNYMIGTAVKRLKSISKFRILFQN